MEIFEKIEAILFLAENDLSISELASFFSRSDEEMKKILLELQEKMANRGINLIIEREEVYLSTNPLCGETVHNFFYRETKPKKLSKAALETISIIAYRQPVTRADVEAIRGVNVDGVFYSLENKNLIRVCGKKETMGKPNLYEVTESFLKYFNIEKVEELPNYHEVKGITLEEEKKEVINEWVNENK